ncbi:MAG: hypothetical protein F6K41_36415 [Symploca sp. SIO3E6]|nr:hypothetical protein [Caldora sp. SIO3E6]
MFTLFSNQDNQLHRELTTLQPKTPPKQIILIASNAANPSDSPTPNSTENLEPMLMYGGVAVAVIIAIAYFSQIQLKSINKLIKTVKKN